MIHHTLSRLVAKWLAHPTGIFQALAISAAWFAAPLVFGISWMGAIYWYLAWCTFISFATQFTLAYQNKKSEDQNEMILKNMTDTMKLVLAVAREVRGELDENQAELLARLSAQEPPKAAPDFATAEEVERSLPLLQSGEEALD